jgi:magnesium-transporting ATPase (P-type)
MITNKLRILIATGISFVFSFLYNGLIHLVVLGLANKQVESLRRVDFTSKLWISILATLVTSFLFTIIYALFVSEKNIKTGSLFGFCFGLFIAIIVDLNQYVLYPLPFSLVTKWALFGVIEFTIIGLLVSSVVKDKT